jgi:hypothetical protein
MGAESSSGCVFPTIERDMQLLLQQNPNFLSGWASHKRTCLQQKPNFCRHGPEGEKQLYTFKGLSSKILHLIATKSEQSTSSFLLGMIKVKNHCNKIRTFGLLWGILPSA